jgi:hypothetical protein
VPPDRLRSRALFALTAAVILAYYFFFTWKSLALYFDQDDMMNLYLAWSKPLPDLLRANALYWTDPLRPLGALFYRAVFALSGFNPLPFRITCLALGIINLALCAWFLKLISGSARVVALAAILFAFHTRLMEVWFRTAVIYDLICFTFFYLAACLYISARRKDTTPGIARTLAIAFCFIAALDAKEVAVALPAVLIAWELLFAKFRWRNLVIPLALGFLVLPYIAAKTFGPNAITNNPYYQPEYTLAHFTETWSTFLGFLFIRPDPVSGRAVLSLLGIPLLTALAARSRQLLFACALIFTATLPMSFLPYRGGFVLYISYVGWVLFAGIALAKLTTFAPPRWQLAVTAALFILIGWRFGKLNLHDQRLGAREWLYDPPRMVRAFADQIHAMHPTLPPNARLLFLEDAFATDEWTPLFILRLQYKNATLVADRVKMMNPKPATQDGYDFVFTYENGSYRQVKP